MFEAIEDLEQDFKSLNLNEGYLQSLEFGFNLLVDKTPKYYLDSNFLLYKHKAPMINKSTNVWYINKLETLLWNLLKCRI